MEKKPKHADVPRAHLGYFHRREWAIIGAPCGEIKTLAFALTQGLAGRYKMAYVDADHHGGEQDVQESGNPMGFGAAMGYTDKISFHRFDLKGQLERYHYRTLFNDQDLVLVNGNHFSASRQIVIIDPRKEASLQKKLDRLTQVDLVLLSGGQSGPYPFLTEYFEQKGWSPKAFALDDHDGISAWLSGFMENALPPLYGLVLAGGKSTRMGQDKGLIDYHGLPQRDHMAELVSRFCEKTFISCRPEQALEIQGLFPPLPDTFLGLGPLGAILSAFREHPDAAWMVIACDLPLLNEATLAELVASRNRSKAATAFNSPFDQFPEPLIAIWEPRSYPIMLQFLAQGYTCPRKVMINSDMLLLDAAQPEALQNVNFPEELASIREVLREKTDPQ